MKIHKFKKKPIVIDAVQYDETSECARFIIDWTRDSKTPAIMNIEIINCSEKYPDGFEYPILGIATTEGLMNVSKNYWVIKGVNGEFYPCKPDIFEKSYDIQ